MEERRCTGRHTYCGYTDYGYTYYGYTYYGCTYYGYTYYGYTYYGCAYYGYTYYGCTYYGEALYWQELHPLPPLTGLTLKATSRARAPRWADDAPPLAPRAAGASPDLLLAATDWLYCTTGWWMIRAGWLALRPRYAVCSVLHLVELRSQFAHSAALDTLKRNRDYVMQAYGAWFAPRPVPSPPMARAVRLPRALLAATGEQHSIGLLLNALQVLRPCYLVITPTVLLNALGCSAHVTWLSPLPCSSTRCGCSTTYGYIHCCALPMDLWLHLPRAAGARPRRSHHGSAAGGAFGALHLQVARATPHVRARCDG